MTSLPFAELHAFCDGDAPHTGNPAAVVLLDHMLGDDALVGIARSNNLSETAYLLPEKEDHWSLRWFTPGAEVDFCGHATLAAGAWLLSGDHVKGQAAHFSTRSGPMSVARTGEPGLYAMDFPAIALKAPGQHPAELVALGGDPVEVWELDRAEPWPWYLVVYKTAGAVNALQPDLARLKASNALWSVTAPGGEGSDFVSRLFAPSIGIDEDPVTGSAHCALGPFWAERLGREVLTARQTGPRPGAVQLRTGSSAPAKGRVGLEGRARPFIEGRLFL
ncbi:MAG: PhzF family phenazine biosynthesis protein [Caulobacterales bacterium]|uniref:PhzF family phenazine biosynthesis protein n=1 Tax=Glycocaulis sp. TaxID=1969725 RepID=UPI003FA05079